MGRGQGEEGSRALSGRRALVVGGSGGIGAAVARSLGRRGAGLVLTGGSSRERLDATLASLRTEGAEAEGFLLDIRRPADLLSRLGGDLAFDLLVCAFGPFVQKPLDETSAEDWERLALLDLALPGSIASALLPGMADRGWGRMLFFGGTGTDVPRAYRTNAAYAATKAGLGVLAKSIAVEHAEDNVAALVACPGLVDTEYLLPEARRELSAKSPRGRLLSVDDIGETLVGLLSADPCLVSGATLALDGGLGLGKRS